MAPKHMTLNDDILPLVHIDVCLFVGLFLTNNLKV